MKSKNAKRISNAPNPKNGIVIGSFLVSHCIQTHLANASIQIFLWFSLLFFRFASNQNGILLIFCSGNTFLCRSWKDYYLPKWTIQDTTSTVRLLYFFIVIFCSYFFIRRKKFHIEINFHKSSIIVNDCLFL